MNTHERDYAIHQRLSRLYVLVVDDSPVDRMFVIAMLKKIGIFNVQIAENGSIAAAKIQNALAAKKPFDLIFLDAKMPTEDGLSLLKWIRSEELLNKQAVIVVSGTSSPGSTKQFIALGANGFVLKPVSLEVLQSQIFEVLHIEE